MSKAPSGGDASGGSGATRPAAGDDAPPGAPGTGENVCPDATAVADWTVGPARIATVPAR